MAVSVILTDITPGGKVGSAPPRVLDTGRAAGYLHTAHVLSSVGTVITAHEGPLIRLDRGARRKTAEKH